MHSVGKKTNRRELFCVLLLLALVSLLYQFYANGSFKGFDYKTSSGNNRNILGCPPLSDGERRVEDNLIFPVLLNFSIEGKIGPHFGQFPIEAKELLKVHNFTDRVLFAYMPAMTQEEKLVSLFVFQKFINVCQQDNITFFIQGGTMLGSYRHHGFVPWDDDIDVYVNSKDRKRLYCSLKKVFPEFDIQQYPHFQWKFYYTKPKTLKKHKYRWPFIDIFFYSIDGNTIYDVTYARRSRAFNYHHVFPLGTSFYEGAYLPAPCDLRLSMNANSYKKADKCHTGSYIHKLEKNRNKMIVKSIPCKRLYDIYPFVFKTNMNASGDYYEEVLKIGSRVLHTIKVKNGCSVKKAKR